MGQSTHPEDLLISAMIDKEPEVRLEHCFASIQDIFKRALNKDRRLLAFLSSYGARYMKKGLIQVAYDYDVTIQYREQAPSSIDDVVVDDGDWDASTLIKKGTPRELTLVTSYYDRVSEKLSEIMCILLSSCEGVHGFNTDCFVFENLSSDTVCTISYDYILPQQKLRQLQGQSAFAAKTVWKSILGKSKVPQFVKPFLAFSYLTQECCFDQRAYDEMESDRSSQPTDPVPYLAYGPLVERRGVSAGFAWAFKALMDEANIECSCVAGCLREETKIYHIWNLVKIDGQFYHVDPTWGIKENGVCISTFMQPDSMMRGTHLWYEEKYPAAKGLRFDYDYIEDFLAENGNEFLDDGANETYFFPDEIID